MIQRFFSTEAVETGRVEILKVAQKTENQLCQKSTVGKQKSKNHQKTESFEIGYILNSSNYISSYNTVAALNVILRIGH